MLKSCLQEEIQRCYQGKFLSMVVSKGMSFSRERWCCATGAKLNTCLVRIAHWIYPPQNILACLSLTRVVFLHNIKILYNLILLQRFTLAVNPRKNYLSEGMDAESPSAKDSDSDSDSELNSESCSDSDSRSKSGSGSVVPSEESPVRPFEETSSENLKDHTTPEKTSPREPDSNTALQDNQIV